MKQMKIPPLQCSLQSVFKKMSGYLSSHLPLLKKGRLYELWQDGFYRKLLTIMQANIAGMKSVIIVITPLQLNIKQYLPWFISYYTTHYELAF